MLIPIKPNQVSKLIPSVGTGGQFRYALGDTEKSSSETNYFLNWWSLKSFAFY